MTNQLEVFNPNLHDLCLSRWFRFLFGNSVFDMPGFAPFCFVACYKLLGIAAARPDGFFEADGFATAFQDVY
jgi:hypothetical protein